MPIQNPKEAEHAAALVDALLAQNLLISIHDGEEISLDTSDVKDEIMEELGATDAEAIMAYRSTSDLSHIGTFYLVYGNSPDELIADHTDNAFCNAIWDELEPVREKLEQ